VSRWLAEWAWLGDGEAATPAVLIETDGDRITTVTPAVPDPPADVTRLGGLVLPGLANAHSHAFHRALRGRTESGAGDFWSWREQMYAAAARLDPDSYFRLARAVYAEMALAGVTAVGEFHYLHRDPDGRPYANANAMGEALAAAAADAGVRLTLIDTCYLRGGFDRPLQGVQRRFGDDDADAWADRAAAFAVPGVRRAAAVHSVRAVPPTALATVAGWAAERDAPLHVHVSEQRAENAACVEATGMTPVRLLAEQGILGARTTAVHATHLTTDDVTLLGQTRSFVCLCPTTERSLADGIGPAADLARTGARLCLGSDSHAVVDLFEEARAVELDERLLTGRRGQHRPDALLRAATETGMAALGWDGGRIEAGRLADFVAVDLGSVRLAGADPAAAAAHVVFAAAPADVTDVVVGGRAVVADRRHARLGDVGQLLAEAIAPDTGHLGRGG
jgi:formiminoglutamate deiminase